MVSEDGAEVVDRLARIETKLDNVLKRDDDHEKRIRWLERIGWAVVVITGGLGFDWISTTVRGVGG